MTDMIPRAEADARVAAAYLDALNCLDGVDSEEDGLGVVWGDFSELATVLSNRAPDDTRAALEAMLAEARREGMLRGAEIYRNELAQVAASAEAGPVFEAALRAETAIRAEAEE